MASLGEDKSVLEGQEDSKLQSPEGPGEPAVLEEKEQSAVVEQERGPVFSSPLENIEEEEEEEIDREALLQEVKEALGEQEQLRAANSQLQHKLAEYLSRKKTEEQADPSRSVTDQEKRYLQCMAALESLEVEVAVMCDTFLRQEHQLMAFRNMKIAEVDEATAEFSGFKREQALIAVHSRSGKRLTAQEVDQCLSLEGRREEEVVQARLENIKLMNRTHKLEALIKQKDQLAEGLHMIDFEQLKINNVDLNEKIEERNEDILKLKSKVTDTVQVLTHVKEKLQFVQGETAEKKLSLQELEAVVARERDHLTRIKQARDALRTDNLRLRQKGGLVSHPALLRDYEERRDQAVELSARLEWLGKRHSELTVLCDGLRRRIEQARTLHTHM